MCIISQTSENPCGVLVVGVCHDSWKVPESQMTDDEAQHETGKHRSRARDRQVRRGDKRDKKAGNERSNSSILFGVGIQVLFSCLLVLIDQSIYAG